MEIIIAGHSHLSALGVPLQLPDGATGLVPVPDAPPHVKALAGPWNGNRDAAYWEALAQHAAGNVIVLLWAGNQHNARFVLDAGTRFDFLLSDAPGEALLEGAVVAPRRAVEASLRPGVDGLPPRIAMLRSAGAVRILLCETPPPRRDLSGVIHVAQGSDFWRRRMEQLQVDPESLQFYPASVRLKLWKLLMRMTAEAGETAMISAPPEALEPEGYLAPQFGATDLTHANRDYGRILLGHLMKELAA